MNVRTLLSYPNASFCAPFAMLGVFMLLFLLTKAPMMYATSPMKDDARVVDREKLVAAMESVSSYDPNATTNGIRFQTDVLLHLVRQAQARAQEEQEAAQPLLIRHKDWYDAFVEVHAQDGDPPKYVRIAHEHEQDILVDYERRNVFKKDVNRAEPSIAANVVLCWKGAPKSYSYKDTLSVPQLKVEHERVISYRLLDFGNMVVCDQIEGLKGKPTTGALGFIFKFISHSRMLDYRIAISEDKRWQVVRTHAKKFLFSKTISMTIDSTGKAEKGVRQELRSLENRLKQDIRITKRDYVALDLDRETCRFR